MQGTKIMVARESDMNVFMEYGTVAETDLDRLHDITKKIGRVMKERCRFRLLQDGKLIDDYWV